MKFGNSMEKCRKRKIFENVLNFGNFIKNVEIAKFLKIVGIQKISWNTVEMDFFCNF